MHHAQRRRAHGRRAERRAVGDAEFQKVDADANGLLDEAEALRCIGDMCEQFELSLPHAQKCHELFVRCDRNNDGVIQLDEFEAYFKV